MPVPDEIKAALASHPILDPSQHRPEYDQYRETWQLYLDLLELDHTKIKALLQKHSAEEDAKKFVLRQSLAVSFNLIPTLVNMIRGYLFGEEPKIDVKDDPDLSEFLANCDGGRTPYREFIRNTVLPLSTVMGFVDVLIQNPFVVGDLVSEKDAHDADVKPRAFSISLLKRINWSCRSTGEYSWICFEDKGNDNPNAFSRNTIIPLSYITISAAMPDLLGEESTGFWLRQWRPLASTPNDPNLPQPSGTIVQPTPETDAVMCGQFLTEANWSPTSRVPVATLYYQKSNDPDRRHFGISKISVIAVLTKKIIQVLSWTDEDVLANLAVLALPTKGGNAPTTSDGKPAIQSIDVFSILFFDSMSKHAPTVVQGHVDHLKFKLALVEAYLQEILRISHLLQSHGKAEASKSGVHAVVQRNELFQELRDTAGSLDRFTLEVFALVKSWAKNEDWTVERLEDEIGPTIDFYKGPYTADALDDVIRDCGSVIELFRTISPTMAKNAMKQVARAFLYASDPDVEKVLKEIDSNADAELEALGVGSLIAEAAAIGGDGQTGTTTTTAKTTDGGEAGNVDTPPAGDNTKAKSGS